MSNHTMICKMVSVSVSSKLKSIVNVEGVFNRTTIPLALVEYEIVRANSALSASLVIYHLRIQRALVE